MADYLDKAYSYAGKINVGGKVNLGHFRRRTSKPEPEEITRPEVENHMDGRDFFKARKGKK